MLCSTPPNSNLDEVIQKVIIEPCLQLEKGEYQSILECLCFSNYSFPGEFCVYFAPYYQEQQFFGSSYTIIQDDIGFRALNHRKKPTCNAPSRYFQSAHCGN